jgi:hypothetical protein
VQGKVGSHLRATPTELSQNLLLPASANSLVPPCTARTVIADAITAAAYAVISIAVVPFPLRDRVVCCLHLPPPLLAVTGSEQRGGAEAGVARGGAGTRDPQVQGYVGQWAAGAGGKKCAHRDASAAAAAAATAAETAVATASPAPGGRSRPVRQKKKLQHLK